MSASKLFSPVTNSENKSLLEKLIVTEEESTLKYVGVNWWRPPTNWTATTSTDFYGEYVRSAYYIKGGEGNLSATWNVPLKKEGYYDVYYHLYKGRQRGRDRGDEKGEYNFKIYSDGEEEDVALAVQNADNGWNHLGSFFFSPDTAKIVLTNKSELRMIYADAVKLVEI